MDIDRAGVTEIVKAPHLVEELIARENAVAIRGKEVEELELLRGNVDCLAVELQLVFLQADFDILEFYDFVVRGLRVGIVTAEHRLDSRGEFLHIEGLDDEVIGAELETEHFVEHFALRGNHDNRLRGNLTDFAADLPAVFFRHHDVEQDEIGFVHFEEVDALGTVGRGLDFVTFVLKVDFQDIADVGVVVDDKKLGIHFAFLHLLTLLKTLKS